MQNINSLESKIYSQALTAAQKQVNKGILVVRLDANLEPVFVFKTSRGEKVSPAINQLAMLLGDMKAAAEWVIKYAQIAYSANLFNSIEAVS